MQIVFDKPNSFSILPTDDKKIIDQFTDYETNYLVVEELKRDDPTDRSIYYTLIDPQTGKVVDIDTRMRQIDSAEKTVTDSESGLKIVSQRTIDPRTGLEKIDEKLLDLATGQELSSSKRIAFSPRREKTVVESYSEYKDQQAEAERFWREEYPRMSLEDRKGYWLALIYRDMRTMGELGYDRYRIFSPATYQEWKAKDPEIDRILDYVIETLPMTGEEQILKRKINDMRGRSGS